MSILEDLSSLSPRKLEKRLGQLAMEALPCVGVWPAEASRDGGLTVALEVDARPRSDVADLGRVLEEEPRALLTSAWARLVSGQRSSLLLRVDVARPVSCEFVIGLDVGRHPHDAVRAALPLLLAASRFLIVTEDPRSTSRPSLWFSAPPDRECLIDLLVGD